MTSSPQRRSPVHPDFERFLTVFERRLETMRLLRDQIRQCPDAIVNLDLLRLERLTARQETLCHDLRTINHELAAIELASPVPPDVQSRADALRHELSNLQAEIARLSRVHQAVLRKARRSIQVMTNVLAFCFPLYAPGEGSAWPSSQHLRK